jgi:hypothetical protein
MIGKFLSKCTKVLVTLAAVALAAVILWVFTIWLEGLPGPHHGAYLAFGSLHNIWTDLKSCDELDGHLPASIGTDAESGETFSWRIEVYQAFRTFASKNNGDSLPDYNRHKTWNDPGNLQLQQDGWHIFMYPPSGDHLQFLPDGECDYSTYFQAITGQGTAFDPAIQAQTLKTLPNDLILVVRVEKSSTHWMKPGDLNVEDVVGNAEAERLMRGSDGYAVLFVDGPWILSKRTPFQDLCNFMTIEGARRSDREKLLRPYRISP